MAPEDVALISHLLGKPGGRADEQIKRFLALLTLWSDHSLDEDAEVFSTIGLILLKVSNIRAV